MANIVISFYAPKQTALFALFVVRAVENDRLFLLSVKRRRLSRKSGGVGGESGQLFSSGCGEGLRRLHCLLARVTRTQRVFVFLPSPLHLSLAIG